MSHIPKWDGTIILFLQWHYKITLWYKHLTDVRTVKGSIPDSHFHRVLRGRASSRGAVGCQINPPWCHHWTNSHSTQCSTAGLTKTMVCAVLSGMVHIKHLMLLIQKSNPCHGCSRFLLWPSLFFIICLMPYNVKKERKSVVCHRNSLTVRLFK